MPAIFGFYWFIFVDCFLLVRLRSERIDYFVKQLFSYRNHTIGVINASYHWKSVYYIFPNIFCVHYLLSSFNHMLWIFSFESLNNSWNVLCMRLLHRKYIHIFICVCLRASEDLTLNISEEGANGNCHYIYVCVHTGCF